MSRRQIPLAGMNLLEVTCTVWPTAPPTGPTSIPRHFGREKVGVFRWIRSSDETVQCGIAGLRSCTRRSSGT